ncbi:MAG TPA: glycoside hydrolase family 44 protein [Polyangiaceae bacterium]|nr:glycoside hydrolase family 44 protein [Polyangiaceae bacterium]
MRTTTGAMFGLAAAMTVAPAMADVSVAVDPAGASHLISPLIYGANFPTPGQIDAGRLTVARWGGNSTTQYNWELDLHNTAQDYYFETLPGCWGDSGNYCQPPTADPKEQSSANAFLADTQQKGLVALFTIPTMGWVPKGPARYDHPFDCSCPVSLYPGQDDVDPFDTDCGNGRIGGAPIDCGDPTRIHQEWTPDDAKAWVGYLVAKLGPSNGKRIYALDNEPALWSSTHFDVRKTRLSYDELWQRMRDFAVAIHEADPTAEISGPAEWGWLNYLCSDVDMQQGYCDANAPDRAAHGGEELMAWILDQAKAYEEANGTRILHYLDLHYYPQGGPNPEVVRSLYDPDYVDPSWINDKIRLLPRMHAWVDQHYPGTKIAISEFDFYDHTTAVGAVTYAEILGIFGREGADMATAWGAPLDSQTSFAAYRLFRNFDGQGAAFERASIPATVTGSGVMAFASVSETRMTVALDNETSQAQATTVSLGNFVADSARAFSNDGGATIAEAAAPTLDATGATLSLPPVSITMLVVDGTNPNEVPMTTSSGVGGGGAGGGTGAGASGAGGGTGGDGGASDGCGCALAGESTQTGAEGAVLALALAALAGARRRRRR